MNHRSILRATLGVATLFAVMLAFGAGGLAADPSSAESKPEADARVDLNTAAVDELMTVPGIGEVMARRIVEWREQHGPFRRVEDLIKVKGVGDKTFEKLRPHVRVGKSR